MTDKGDHSLAAAHQEEMMKERNRICSNSSIISSSNNKVNMVKNGNDIGGADHISNNMSRSNAGTTVNNIKMATTRSDAIDETSDLESNMVLIPPQQETSGCEIM